MVSACSLKKPFPAAKVAERVDNSPPLCCTEGAKACTHKEYQRFAAWPFQRLVRNMHELAQNLSWNETATITHMKSSCYLFINVQDQGSCASIAHNSAWSCFSVLDY